MKLHSEHFLFLCMNQIDTFILITSWTTSRYFSKTCVRIVLSYFFIFPKEFNIVLDSLLSLGEFSDFQSEMFTDGLTTKTYTEKGSIAPSLNNLSYFFHFFIRFIIDIARATSKYQNIFLRFIISIKRTKMRYIFIFIASFRVVDHTDVTSERFCEASKRERKIITEIDNCYFFSNEFRAKILWII